MSLQDINSVNTVIVCTTVPVSNGHSRWKLTFSSSSFYILETEVYTLLKIETCTVYIKLN